MWQTGRVAAFTALFGYCWMYGAEGLSPADIFLVLRLLQIFQVALDAMIGVFTALAQFKPSCKRIEAFLKLPEAPSGKPRRDEQGRPDVPPWMRLWPSAG